MQEEKQTIEWQRWPEGFDDTDPCAILVPEFYDNKSGFLSGLVSDATVYFYKPQNRHFFSPGFYPVEYIPIDQMKNHCSLYINLDKIKRPQN